MQQLQSQLQATANAAGQAPQVQSPVNTGPVCNQTTNGQCVNQTGLQGPNGSTCLRFVGSQCAYYGNPPQQQTAATGQLTSTLGQTTGGLNGTSTALGAAGCAQWNGTQCLTPAGAGVGTGTNTNTGSGGFMPGLALTYPAGVVGNGTSSTVGTSATNSLATAASITPGTSSSAIQSTAAAAGVSPYQLSQMGGSQGTAISPSLGTASSTASGVCTQYGPSGNCMSFR